MVTASGCSHRDTAGADRGPAAAQSWPQRPAGTDGPLPVLTVIDGDTVSVARGDQPSVTVRLIGIDTPETVDPDQPVQCFGPQAADRATQLLAGQRVWLEHDPATGRTDRYGRELAYLWLPDGRLANLLLVDGGYAREAGYGRGYRYAAVFRAAQADARADRRGLWATCP